MKKQLFGMLTVAVCFLGLSFLSHAQSPYHGPNPPPDNCLARCGSTQDCSKGCAQVKKRTTAAAVKTTATVKKTAAK